MLFCINCLGIMNKLDDRQTGRLKDGTGGRERGVNTGKVVLENSVLRELDRGR